MWIKLILAIITVESGGDNYAVGDNGNAYGCLQIWPAYVQDANEYAGTSFTHEDAFNQKKSALGAHRQPRTLLAFTTAARTDIRSLRPTLIGKRSKPSCTRWDSMNSPMER